jgi:hypothetical protein
MRAHQGKNEPNHSDGPLATATRLLRDQKIRNRKSLVLHCDLSKGARTGTGARLSQWLPALACEISPAAQSRDKSPGACI